MIAIPLPTLKDYFYNDVVVVRVATLEDVRSAKGAELDPADRYALRRRQYVVIYDGVRQRVCHQGFLREKSAPTRRRKVPPT